MAYLNDVDVKQGGGTRFYSEVPLLGAVHMEQTPRVDVQPKLGRMVIFNHKVFHEGLELLEGKKHILRSDVFFRVSSASDYYNTSNSTSTASSLNAPPGMRTPDSKV